MFESVTTNEGELFHEVRTRFSIITDELMFLEVPVPIVKQVSRILKILPRSWTNDFVTGNKTRESDVITMHKLFEHLQVHEMHKKMRGSFSRSKTRRLIWLMRPILRKKIMTTLPTQVKCMA